MTNPNPGTTTRDIIRALTQPGHHVQPYRAGWKYKNRTGPIIRTHKTDHASLLDQLRDAITQRAIIGKWRPIPPGMSDTKTMPHFDADAFDRLQTIRKETVEWLRYLGIPSASNKLATTITAQLITISHAIKDADAMTAVIFGALGTLRDAAADIRDSIEPDLRALANHTFDVDNPDPETRRNARTDQRQLERDARHWHTWCRIFAGWEIPPARPRVPCPNCDAEQDQGKGLRVRFDDLGAHDATDTAAVRAAVCLSCNATWDERSIGILAEHIRQATDPTRSSGENSPPANVDVDAEIVHASGWGEDPDPGPPRNAPHAADVGPCR